MNYYNEIEPFAAQWLRNLIDAELIPPGDVDTKSIKEVTPDDIQGYTQCHFFAGVAGWSLALEIAGVAAATPLWSGSCPCQPFSNAGARQGESDERHLWPDFSRLIAKCRPAIVFGEQVASKAGRLWLAGVRNDLEAMGYAVGGADLCAAGIGAPHIRQRLYWVADSHQERWRNPASSSPGPECYRLRTDGMGGRAGHWSSEGESRRFEDGSTRWTKPGVGLLVDGFPGRVATVGAFGNAIVPQLAAEFIKAFFEAGT